MKFLHTSDWHLGRNFHGHSMEKEQEAFCQRIIDLVKEKSVDVVLIAGDVFDSGRPRIESLKLYEKTLVGIVEAGAKVFMISGNHDNRARLGTLKQFMEAVGFHARTEVEEINKPLIVEDEFGEVAIYGIPYLQPRTDRDILELEDKDVNHIGAMTKATELITEDLKKRGNPRSIVVSHAFVKEGEVTDGVRNVIGGIDDVPYDLFQDFSYTALGHLHGQQEITDTVRYSGTPMPYSFSETDQTKGFYLFELDENGLGKIEAIPHTNYRKLARIKGSLEELLENSDYVDSENKWCQITVKQEEAPAKPFDKLKARFPYICDLKTEYGKEDRVFKAPKMGNTKTENPIEVLEDFVDYSQAREADEVEKEFIKEGVVDVMERTQA